MEAGIIGGGVKLKTCWKIKVGLFYRSGGRDEISLFAGRKINEMFSGWNFA